MATLLRKWQLHYCMDTNHKNTARDVFDNKCINKTNSGHIILSFTCKSLTQCTSFSGTYPLTLSGWDPLTLSQAFPGIP